MTDFLHYLTMPYLLSGMQVTLQLLAMGVIGGILLGLILASMLLSRFRIVAAIARTYTTLYRGTPLILQLVFVFTVLPHAGIVFTPLVAGGIALAMNEASFFAEIFRSGVREVPAGQRAAGRALGMTPGSLFRRVVGPQAFRTMVPAIGNGAVATMKNSALASIIAVPELTLRTQQLASSTFDYFEIYFATAVMYLVLTAAITTVQLIIEALVDPDSHGARFFRRLLRRRSANPVDDLDTARLRLPEARSDSFSPIDRDLSNTVSLRTGTAGPDLEPRMIEIHDLHKSYGDTPVLRGVDMTVRAGEVVALLGPSGSGKSTLLRTINHLDGYDSGSIRVGGICIGRDSSGTPVPERDAARQRVKAQVGMVFQNFNLFEHLSVRENIAAPLRWVQGLDREAAYARADELLAVVDMESRADALPRHLSGGQQQRVAIARALAPRPQTLLLDEPTSALDPEKVAEVLQVIRDLARYSGITMIIATHQMRFARDVADRAVFMANGVVVEEGPAEEVLLRPQHPSTQAFLGSVAAAEI